MNHFITRIGALIKASANSTIIVTHKQQGHKQVNANLQPSQTQGHTQNFSLKTSTPKQIEKRELTGPNPTIQMMTPTREIMRERKAKGRPNRKPKGLHSQSSLQQQQHIAKLLVACLLLRSWLLF